MTLDDKSKDNLKNHDIKEYGSSRTKSSMLWTSMQTGSTFDNPPDMNQGTRDNGELLSSHHLVRNAGQTSFHARFDSEMNGQIWRNVNANTFFNTSPQKAIQGLLGLKAGDNLLMFDMETLGTFKKQKGDVLDWYTPTEIAMVHSRYNADGTVSVVDGAHARRSLLVRPNDNAFSHINELLQQLKNSKGKAWQHFSNDQRRTLSDLTLYGTKDISKIFSTVNGVTSVHGQMRENMPLPGSIFDARSIEHMELGLANLRKYGNRRGTIANEINTMMHGIRTTTKQDIKIGGYNIHAFDIPLFMDYINSGIAKNNPNSTIHKSLQTLQSNIANTQHVDLYAGINSLYTDSLERFGVNKKLENLVTRFGIDKIMSQKYANSSSHFAAYDAESTAHLFNHMLSDQHMQLYLDNIRGQKYKDRGYNMSPMEIGDRFFAHKGLRSSSENPHDAVFRLENNVFKMAYDFGGDERSPSIYKNSTYRLFGLYKDLPLSDGKSYHGAMLHNIEDDLYHFIARNSMTELQDVLHSSLSYLGQNSSDPLSHKFTNNDRALRHYSRIYSDEGGVNLFDRTYRGLDALQAGKAQGMTDEAFKWSVMKAGGWEDLNGVWHLATPEFYRNIKILAPRLEAERNFVTPFVDRLKTDANFKKSNGKFDREAQGIALRNFRRGMDSAFGENKSQMQVGGNGAIGFDLDGNTKYVTLNSREAIKGQIRSLINDGHIDTPSNYVVKSRLLSLANQVKAVGSISGKAGKPGLSHTEIDRIVDQVKSMGDKESYNNVIEYLGNILYDMRKVHSDLGLKTINVEDPTRVIGSRYKAMQEGFATQGQGIMDEAINQTLPFRGKGLLNGKLNILGDSPIAHIFNAHNESLDMMIRKSKLDHAGIAKSVGAEQKISDLAKAFMDNDMEVAVMYHGKKRGLVMAIANKADAERIFKLAPNEIIENNKAVILNLPIHNKDGTMKLPGQERTARMKVMKNKDGYYIGSGFDEVMQAILGRARYSSGMIKNGDALGAQAYLNSIVNKTVQNLSLNNSKVNMANERMFHVDQSAASQWMRGGIIDLSELAEEWYSQHYTDNKGKQRFQELLNQAKREHKSFVDLLSMGERMVFQRDVDRFATEKFGPHFHTDAGSVKDTHVSQYLRSTRDVRELTPFGFFNPLARENIMKSVNYLPLDTDETANRLRNALRKSNPKMTGNKIEAEVSRRMNRRFITNTANEVLSGETNYLNLRAAYMTDEQLAKLALKKKDALAKLGFDPAKLSTYEGMFLISDDIADAFHIKREKSIIFNKDTKMSEDVMQAFTKEGYGSLDNDIALIGRHRLSDYVKRGADGQYTVGSMVVDGKMLGTASYDDWQDNVFIKGWSADRNALILEKEEELSNGWKGITDVGNRATASRTQREVFKALGIDADIILAPSQASHGQFGSEAYKTVNLVLDEALRQQGKVVKGKFTVGKMGGTDTLDAIAKMMSKHFGVNDYKVVDGRILMDSDFGKKGGGIGLENIHNFLTDADHTLGTNFANGSIMYGNVGLGAANVYNWENGLGIVHDDHEGLVRWGPKEIQVIQSRLDRLSAEGLFKDAQGNVIEGKNTLVGQWLHEHMDAVAKSQEKDARVWAKGLIDTSFTYQKVKIKDNDIIIKTRGLGFGSEDVSGLHTARKVGNNVEVSMHAFNDLPLHTTKNQKLTVQDYHKTIVSMGDLEITRMMENGSVKDIEPGHGFRTMLKKSGGTVMFEMPDDTFSHSHVRFISSDLKGIGQTPILQKLQRSQMDIWRKSRVYMDQGNLENHDMLQEALDKYHQEVAHVISSARDGSIVKQLLSADMDMSGRFRTQTLNPLAQGAYEESTAYVSRDRMLEMISSRDTKGMLHVDQSVARVLGINVKDLEGEALNNKVLDHIAKNGLYGFVGRYPTIAEDTMQVMKLAIDPTMGKNDRQAYLTVATELRLKADNDGDFISAILAHYKKGNVGIHNEMSKIWAKSKEAIEKTVPDVMQGLIKESKDRGISVGTLMTSPQFAEYRNSYAKQVFGRTSNLDNREALEARLGKGYVGMADNLRRRLNDLADDTYRHVQGANLEGYSPLEIAEKKAMISEFGRALSQNLISSKKFNITNIKEELGPNATDQDIIAKIDERISGISLMTDSIRNSKGQGRQGILRANEILENPISDLQIPTADGYKSISIDQALDAIEDMHKLNGGNLLNNPYLGIGESEGQAKDLIPNLFSGKSGGHPIIGTSILDGLAGVHEELDKVFSEHATHRKQQVLYNANKIINGTYDTFSSMLKDYGNTEISSPALHDTVSQDVGASISQVAREFTSGLSGMGGFGFGAIRAGMGMFAGMWAMSALTRSGPTPEETKRNGSGEIQNIPTKGMMQQQVARVTPNENGEDVNISISHNAASSMSHEQVAALVNNELSAMMPMQLNMNMNVKDNTQSIDKQWLQGIVAQSLSTGRVF